MSRKISNSLITLNTTHHTITTASGVLGWVRRHPLSVAAHFGARGGTADPHPHEHGGVAEVVPIDRDLRWTVRITRVRRHLCDLRRYVRDVDLRRLRRLLPLDRYAHLLRRPAPRLGGALHERVRVLRACRVDSLGVARQLIRGLHSEGRTGGTEVAANDRHLHVGG